VHRPKDRVPITPATKVADLLDSWPELEEVLIAQTPAFRRLRNPVLRRTVARVATLEQAAGVGGVSVRALVTALRQAAGMPEDAATPPKAEGGATVEPAWVGSARGIDTIDAEALLDAGEVPLGRVNESARRLGEGEALLVLTSFHPVPLKDTLERQGFRVFVREKGPSRFETVVTRGTGS